MTIERVASRVGLRALLALCICPATAVPAFGQASPAFRFPAFTADSVPVAVRVPQYLSDSGAVAVGFTPHRVEAHGFRPMDPCAMLPAGSSIPRMAGALIERMFRASPTFRRQWVRLTAARVRVRITLDHGRIVDGSAARSLIDAATLQVHIQLRGADRRLPEHLAHEIEHVLEQLDGADLAEAAARGVRGVAGAAGSAFETRRAIVIGRIVAGEVQRVAEGG